MKCKRIRRLAPCPAYDVEKIESWLQDMAREGWILEPEGTIFGLLSFVKEAPQILRYRLEPKEPGAGFGDTPDPEVQELCKEYGWEYVDSYASFFIYRAARLDAREMNTDLQVQAAALKAGKRGSTVTLVLDLILLSSIYSDFFQTPFWSLVHMGLAYHLVLLIALIWSSADTFLQWRHLRRLHKQLKANIPLEHNKPWRRSAAFHIFSKFAYALVLLLLFGVIFGSCTRSLELEQTPTQDYPGNPPFATAADILPEGEFEAQSFLNTYNTYTVDSTFFAPEIIEWKEYGVITLPDGSTYDGSLVVTYYQARSSWLAEGLMEDLYRQAEENSHFVEIFPPALETDDVRCYNTIYPTILLRQGSIVVKCSVGLERDGDYLLDQWALRMADMLTSE